MARRRRPEKRIILPDPKYGDEVLSKFMNSVMLDGKKSVAESIVYSALQTVEQRAKREPIGVFHDALNNIKPGIEVRSRRVGGAQPQRDDDGRAPVGRVAGRRQQPRQRGEEARRHAPHGRGQPRLLALSLVRLGSLDLLTYIVGSRRTLRSPHR